jgi:hypothetical protein
MKRNLLASLTFCFVILGAATLLGQSGGVPFAGPGPQGDVTFLGFQAGLGNRVVAGAPYSATVTSEFVQTLADGNTIQRKSAGTVYRDSQGRTRREQTLPAIGQYSASGNAPQAIFISDPVAGVNYILDPVKKTARKMPGGPGRGGPGGPVGPGGPGGPGRGPGGNPPQGNAGPRQNQNVTTETLNDMNNIEGILVQGTRITRTIPAETVGNQNAMQVTSERWYSPDLKLDLLVKNNNPTGGRNTTAFSNIRRDEPDPSLFQVPADYTVQEPPKRPMMRGRRGGPPPPPPSPQQ